MLINCVHENVRNYESLQDAVQTQELPRQLYELVASSKLLHVEKPDKMLGFLINL